MKTEILQRYHLFMNGVQIGRLGFDTAERAEAASRELQSLIKERGAAAVRVATDPEFDFAWRVSLDGVLVDTMAFPDKDEATSTAFAIQTAFGLRG
jgi:hypothetical protein